MWFPLSRLLRITPEIPGQFALLWPTTVWQLPVSVCVNVCVCALVWSTGMSLRTNRAHIRNKIKKKISKKQKSKKRREISMEAFADVVFYQQQNRRKKSIFKSVPQCQCVWDTCGGIQHVWLFLLQVISEFSGSLVYVCLCVHITVCVCLCVCRSLPLMSCWHTGGRSLLKKTSVWIWLGVTLQPRKHSTSMHRRSRALTLALQSLFKRQTRAVLLS